MVPCWSLILWLQTLTACGHVQLAFVKTVENMGSFRPDPTLINQPQAQRPYWWCGCHSWAVIKADVDVDDVEAEEGTITVYTALLTFHLYEEFQVTELEMTSIRSWAVSEDLENLSWKTLWKCSEDDEDVKHLTLTMDSNRNRPLKMISSKGSGLEFFRRKAEVAKIMI